MTELLPSASLFRRYDIRGIVGSVLTAKVVCDVAQAYASLLIEAGESQAILGRDVRLTSPEFSRVFADALIATGIDVFDVGIVSTPVAHFASHHTGIWNSVVVTGSHNPRDYNGIKLNFRGAPLHGEALQALYQRILKRDFFQTNHLGQYQTMDVSSSYQCAVAGSLTLNRKLRVAVDCGNGAAGLTAPAMLSRLGCEVVELFSEPDGAFPNHHPDPADPKNLVTLRQTVLEQQLDLGIAFDGDGDRLGVVDSAGKIIWPDRLMILLSRDILKNNPNSKIVYDVKSSRFLGEEILAAGGEPLMVSSGHSLIREKMTQVGAAFGGELSGHLFFSDRWYGFDDAPYAAGRVLEILSQTNDSSEAVFAGIPDAVNTPEITVTFPSELGLSDFMAQFLQDEHDFEDAEISRIDGLRADFSDGWGLARESHTTPSLSLRFEGRDQDSLERIQSLFKRELLATSNDLKLPF